MSRVDRRPAGMSDTWGEDANGALPVDASVRIPCQWVVVGPRRCRFGTEKAMEVRDLALPVVDVTDHDCMGPSRHRFAECTGTGRSTPSQIHALT